SKWRKGLMDDHAVLVSPFYPEAGFSAGNAMARNKYIYCLADSSLVIHSGKKGGTLNGAEENLKKAWVPLWVKQTTDKDAANANLVTKGGRWLEADTQAFKIAELMCNEGGPVNQVRSEEHTSELQSRENLVCRLLLEKKKQKHVQQKNHKK